MIKHSIVIPTYNKCDQLLKPCIESILKYTDLEETEIIVVANGCTDNTKEYIMSLNHVNIDYIWFDERLGYPKAVNAGMHVTKGEFIIPLNNDTQLLPQGKNDWINILKEPFLQDSTVGLTGPMKAKSPSAGNKEFLIFFCVMIRASVINEIGYLDEEFGDGYGEDTAFCLEAEKAGFKVLQVPDESQKFYGHNKRTGNFPIYHEGNVTFKNWEGGEQLLAKNNQILSERYDNVEISQSHEKNDEWRVAGMLHIQEALKCDGYMSEKELIWLADHAILSKCIVEIGSWHGRSSRAIADNLPDNGILFCIDTWQGSKVEQNTNHASARQMDGDHAFYEFLQNNIDLVESGKIVPIRMSSKKCSKIICRKRH